jgi:hypothetical protein
MRLPEQAALFLMAKAGSDAITEMRTLACGIV